MQGFIKLGIAFPGEAEVCQEQMCLVHMEDKEHYFTGCIVIFLLIFCSIQLCLVYVYVLKRCNMLGSLQSASSLTFFVTLTRILKYLNCPLMLITSLFRHSDAGVIQR